MRLADVPIARDNDPVTSQLAAMVMNDSGMRETQVGRVRKALTRFPGHTSWELSELANMERYSVERRLSDLKRLGEATSPDDRKRLCRVSGRLALTWYPVVSRQGADNEEQDDDLLRDAAVLVAHKRRRDPTGVGGGVCN